MIKLTLPYWQLKLNELDFKKLLGFVVDNDMNNISIRSNIKKFDYTTIEEVFEFLRQRQTKSKFKKITVEGALLGEFVLEDGEGLDSWEYWLKKDIDGRYAKGEYTF